MNCRTYERKNLKVKNYSLKNKQKVGQVKIINYNSFAPLQERNLECFFCHNYGHKEGNYRLMEILERPKEIREKMKLWKGRTLKEECLTTLKTHDKGNIWYDDSGCSKHMTGDEDKFLKLKT